jgi:hypothetical protein
LPAAVRTVDATIAMATIGGFPLLINGYSGFTPDSFQQFYKWERTGWQLEKITDWVSEIWPDVYLILDKHAIHWLATGWRQPFPLQQLEKQWKCIIQDDLYALYKLKIHTDTKLPVVRRVRTDILQSHPILFFSARIAAPNNIHLPVGIFLNGIKIDQEKITNQWHEYKVSLPLKFMGNLSGEEIKLKMLGDNNLLNTSNNRWKIKGMHFEAIQ